MAFQRAAVLYPLMSSQVDGGAVNVYNLSDTQPGADNTTTATTNGTKNTTVERTFNPGISGANANNAATTNVGAGWAIPTADMATVDSACSPTIAAQTVTVTLFGGISSTGVALSNDVYTFRASLWKWNMATHTGTLLVGGSATALTQSAVSVYSVSYTKSITLSLPATTFGANEILMLVCGAQIQTSNAIAAHSCGANLFCDNANTNITFATSGLRQACTLSTSLIGEGFTSREALAIDDVENVVADGLASREFSAILASRDVLAEGIVSRQFAVAQERTPVGDGLVSRVFDVTMTDDLIGDGVATKALDVGLTRDTAGDGLANGAKAVTAAKAFDLAGDGLVDYAKATDAYRSFDIAGDGVVTGRIELPIDELPTGGGGTTVHTVVVTDDHPHWG